MSKSSRSIQIKQPTTPVKKGEVSERPTEMIDTNTTNAPDDQPPSNEGPVVEQDSPAVQESQTSEQEIVTDGRVVQVVAHKYAEQQLERFSKPLQDAIISILDGDDVRAKVLLYTVLEYSIAMHPSRSMNSQNGTAIQVSFFRQLVAQLNSGADNFDRAFKVMLGIIHELKTDGAFSDPHPFRFLPQMALPSESRVDFQNLIHLLIECSDVKNRNNQHFMRQINLAAGVRGLNENGRHNVRAALTL
jgi:hypothetical protein